MKDLSSPKSLCLSSISSTLAACSARESFCLDWVASRMRPQYHWKNQSLLRGDVERAAEERGDQGIRGRRLLTTIISIGALGLGPMHQRTFQYKAYGAIPCPSAV